MDNNKYINCCICIFIIKVFKNIWKKFIFFILINKVFNNFDFIYLKRFFRSKFFYKNIDFLVMKIEVVNLFVFVFYLCIIYESMFNLGVIMFWLVLVMCDS